MARNELFQKLAELRRLAASSRRKLGEITGGLLRLRGELRALETELGAAVATDAEEAERDFEDLKGTGARLSRHDA